MKLNDENFLNRKIDHSSLFFNCILCYLIDNVNNLKSVGARLLSLRSFAEKLWFIVRHEKQSFCSAMFLLA